MLLLRSFPPLLSADSLLVSFLSMYIVCLSLAIYHSLYWMLPPTPLSLLISLSLKLPTYPLLARHLPDSCVAVRDPTARGPL